MARSSGPSRFYFKLRVPSFSLFMVYQSRRHPIKHHYCLHITMQFNFRGRDLWNKVKPKFESYGDVDATTESALEKEVGTLDRSKVPFITWRVILLVVVASMGGFIFGYHTGERHF